MEISMQDVQAVRGVVVRSEHYLVKGNDKVDSGI